MENALLVTSSKKSVAFFTEMLKAASCDAVTIAHSGGVARRLLLERDFDIAVINVPLPDETGEALSKHIAAKEIGQVVLIVKSEFYEEMSAATEDAGVLVVANPVDRNVFWSALKLAKSAQNRLKKVHAENSSLKQKIEDIRIIDRAKCLLISTLKMSEQEAHRFLEKQAMDMRSSRRSVAEGVLRTYDV